MESAPDLRAGYGREGRGRTAASCRADVLRSSPKWASVPRGTPHRRAPDRRVNAVPRGPPDRGRCGRRTGRSAASVNAGPRGPPDRGARRTGGCMPAQVGPPDRRGACRPEGARRPEWAAGPRVHAGASRTAAPPGPRRLPDGGRVPDRDAPSVRGASRSGRQSERRAGPGLRRSLTLRLRGPLPAGDRDACPATAGLEMGASQESLPADGRGAGAASLATGRAHARGPLRIALPAGNHPAGRRRGRPAQPAASGRRRIAPERNGAPRGTLIVARRPSRGRGARLPAPPGANPYGTGRGRAARAVVARPAVERPGGWFDAAPTMGVLSTWRAWSTAQDLMELC